MGSNIKYKWILGCLSSVLLPQTSYAQPVDYGSLESVFGEPVTTSSTGTPQRASEVAANMTIITAEEIRQSGTRNIPQIIGMYVPGIDVMQSSTTSFDVGVRGYQQADQPRMLVLLDGRQVFIDDYSRTVWGNIPVNIDDIRQIEVVKGASSALFGSNAASGVINIITYSPIYDHNNVASATVRTQNSTIGDATVTANGSWGGTKFSAGGLRESEFNSHRTAGSDQPPSTPRHEYALNSTVFQVAPNVQINTEATYSYSTDNFIDPFDYITAAQDLETWSARAGASWQSPYGLITTDNYLNHSAMRFFSTPVGDNHYSPRTDLFLSQLQDQFRIGTDNTFRVAVEYRHKEFQPINNASLIPESPDLIETNYTINGTWLWQINDKWSWTNALRLDQQNISLDGTLAPDVTDPAVSHTNNTWSANSDLVYNATPVDKFRLGYGRGVQLPSLAQSGASSIYLFDGFPIDAEGNPLLKPTIAQDIGFDYDRKLLSLYSTLKLSTFYEYNSDITALPVVGTKIILGDPYTLFRSQNVGNSQGLGGEIEFKGKHPDGYRWNASYSYSRVADNDGVRNIIDYQGSTPRSHFRLLLGYTTGAWEFDTNGKYVTSSNIIHSTDGGVTDVPTPTKGYASVGGRIGYKIDPRFTVALSGTNLTQVYTRESPYPTIERQVFLTLTGHF